MKIFYLLPGYLGFMGLLFLVMPRQMVVFDNFVKRKCLKFLKDSFSDHSKVRILRFLGIGFVLFSLFLIVEIRKHV